MVPGNMIDKPMPIMVGDVYERPLISHEIPLSLIDEHQDSISDYMFVLLHKAIEDPVYFRKAGEYRDAGGMVYLDNSCFELGASLDNETLFEYYERLQPDIVILPDVLGDREATLTRTFDFLKDYPSTIANSMAVAQGATEDELIKCYKEMVSYRNQSGERIAMIGIPFVYRWVDRDPYVQTQARISLLHRMVTEDIIDMDVLHHLLGTWQAREFAEYARKEYYWIYSIDTSNPIMAAIDGDVYGSQGLVYKPRATFDSIFHLKESDIDMDLLYNNVIMFRRIAAGDYIVYGDE
jgi:hypothetical protein